MTPRAQKRVDAFYEWEARGRGKLLWECPVRVEPPFSPFNRDTGFSEVPDDGQIETFSSMVSGWLTRPLGRRSKSSGNEEIEESRQAEECPEPDDSDDAVTELEIALPQASSVSRDLAEQFLLSLQHCRFPISFEVLGRSDRISVQFAGRQPDVSLIRRQLEAHFPDVAVTETDSGLQSLWDDGAPSLIFDLGLGREFMLPLLTPTSFSNDPFTGVAGALTDLKKKELGLLQILFEPVRQPWSASMLQSVTNGDGSGFFSNAPEFLPKTRTKIQKPLYALVCRIAAQSDNYDRVLDIAIGIAGALTIVNDPAGNELIPLGNESYDFNLHLADLIDRRTHRSGMILNVAEVVSFVHLPNTTVRIPKLVRYARRTKAAPLITENNPILLGENRHAGESRRVTVNDEQRVRHTHVIGSSGSGKSTLLINMIRQDIERGNGLAVFDPHGDLIDQVIGHIPEERFDDVILFDPSDEEFPIGLNILSAHSELEKNLLASDLVSVFQRLSTSWGDQMTAVLRNAILAMLESSRGGTLFDLRRFLVEPPFREEFLKSVSDSQVVYFWKKEFPMLTGRPQAPLLTRLNTFLGPKLIRNMVAQRGNKINFAEVMDSGKIFLAKLSQGALGEENSYLLGSLLVAKFYQLVMSRQAVEASDRRHFWLYIDEFHNFVCTSMASILTGARKYRMGLTLAHQELKQIEHRDSNVSSAVLANPYTRICFRLGDDDARKLSSGFSYFEPSDLQNLGVGEAICRIERADYDFNLKVPFPPNVDAGIAKDKRQQIRELSRSKYATPKDIVQEQIERELTDLFDEPEAPDLAAPKRRTSTTAPSKPTTASPRKRDVSKVSDKPSQEANEKEPDPSTPVVESEVEAKDGKTLHESLKESLSREAEKLDYTVTRELSVLDGKGRIDLVFVRGGVNIACEIGITTTAEHEAANVRKCGNAGFKRIAVVAPTRKRLEQIKEAVGSSVDQGVDISYNIPEELISALQRWAREDLPGGEKERAKPRKQKINLNVGGMSDEERREKEKEMLKTLSETMGRKKKSPKG